MKTDPRAVQDALSFLDRAKPHLIMTGVEAERFVQARESLVASLNVEIRQRQKEQEEKQKELERSQREDESNGKPKGRSKEAKDGDDGEERSGE